MHEVSLVRSIAATLEQEFGADELEQLTDVRLRVGILSNVQPVLMQNAFRAVQEGEGKLLGVKLHVEVLPAIVECEMCGARTEIDNYKFACGTCERPTSNIVQGTELLIHNVAFAEASPTT